MRRSIANTLRTAALLALAVSGAAAADTRAFILVGLDGKTFFEAHGGRNGPNGHDAVGILDISDEAHPRLVHTLPLDS